MPRNYIWATLPQKRYQAISPEPYLKFSQIGSHFRQNHRVIAKNNYEISKIFLTLGSGAWKLYLGHVDPKDALSHSPKP